MLLTARYVLTVSSSYIEDGAVLVRPDTHVGWRCDGLPDDPQGTLREVLTQILHRED